MHNFIPAPPGFEGRPAREWPVPPMDHAAGDKDSAFTTPMGRVILARIVEGETVKAICADPRMPAYCTVYQWRRVHPGFAASWDQVRQVLAARAIAAREERRINDAARREAEIDGGLRRRRTGGKWSSYTRAMGQRICGAVAAGAPLYRVLKRPGMPTTKVVYAWLRQQDEFRRMYVDACEDRLRALSWRIEGVIDQVMDIPLGMADLPAANRELARLKGRIGLLTPKTYRRGVVW